MSTQSILAWVLLLASSLPSTVAAQSTADAVLAPDVPLDRDIAGGQSHSYRITLAANQFVRFRLDQRALDDVLILMAPDGTQLAEMDVFGVGELESLSLEAAVSGDYRVIVRNDSVAPQEGSYRLEASVHATATEQDRKRLAAEALVVQAGALGNQGAESAKQVIEKLEQAVPLWRALDEPAWIAKSLQLTGSAYSSLRDEKARGFYEQSLAICRESKLRAGEADALVALGDTYYAMADFAKSAELYEQALPIKREVKDRRGEADVLGGLAIAYQTMRKFEKVFDYHEQELAIHRELKDRVAEAWTLQALANAYSSVSRPEDAIAAGEQALSIFRDLKNLRGEGRILSLLGLVNLSLSRYEKAIDLYEQALTINREQKDRAEEGWTLDSLGGAYAGLRRYDEAIKWIEQALAIGREVKDRVAEGRALLDLGSVSVTMGRPEKAIEYLEQSLTLSRASGDRNSEGYALSSLGSAYAKLGRPEKAIESYEQALAIHRATRRRPQEGSTLNSLAGVYRSLGQYDKAIDIAGQALTISREVKNREYEVSALSTLARTESDRGNLVAARNHVEECLRVAEGLRSGEIVSPKSRATMLASVQSSYQLDTDLLMRQHKAEPTMGFDALALAVSERQRARSLLDLLAEAGADLRSGVDPALLEHEAALTKQLNEKAKAQASTPEEAGALEREISQLENDLERAQVAIRQSNPHYAALAQPRPLTLVEIQQQLDADTVLLEYALGEERSYLWAVTRDSLKSYELPRGRDIDQSARLVVELLTARSLEKRGESPTERERRITQAEIELPTAATALSATVLAPAAADLGTKRVVVVADGALQYVPFAMLPAPLAPASSAATAKAARPPLVVDHEVVSLPSASALAVQRTELAGRQPAPKLLAVIADPVFDRSDVRLKSVPRKASDGPASDLVAANDARSIEHLAQPSDDATDGEPRRLVIPRLPYTRQEATRLLAMAPKNSSFGAVDFQASRATVLSGDLSQYRYVHFATHGLLDAERPGLSSLVLSMVDADGKAEDGFLRANDIYNLKLPAELVVLSACQTGLGTEIKGEGLIGLTRGFMYAGAARVVVSLWNVNDRATADLMAKFYERMLKQGERPAAALRAAQVEMWKQKQWRSPYYWSAFVLQGEWR